MVEQVSQRAKAKPAYVEIILKESINVMKQAIKEGEAVKLYELGTLQKKRSKAKNARNPRTGKSIKVPPSYRVKFQVSRKFKELINAG
jgi:DNA-binding protein HU-beta